MSNMKHWHTARCMKTSIHPSRSEMIIAVRSILSQFSSFSSFLIPSSLFASWHSLSSPRSPSRRGRRLKNNSSDPPQPDQSQIDAAIASLPPRFTPSDLSACLSRLPDPRHCIPLLLHSTNHRTHLLRSGDASAVFPFLTAVKRLGAARFYREMDSAASLAFSFPSLPLPEPFFNTLIHFYSEARWISKAIGVYKRMRSSSSPAKPTARTFNLLFATLLGHRGANSYIHHLYMDALRSLFRQMLDSGITPDPFSLNAMIKGYVLSLHLNDALRIFHQMVPIYGVEPDEHTYSYLVHGLCAQGRTQNARELYVEMRGKGLVPTGRACNSLVSALAMVGEVEEAVTVMWEAVEMSWAPDFITCRTVVEEICRQRSAGYAAELIREMREKEVIDGQCYRELLGGVGGSLNRFQQ